MRSVAANSDLGELGLPFCDRAALTAIYNATGGSNWRVSTNWLSNEPLGEWHGVTTDERGRVTQLDLSDNGLTGEIPVELGNLANLKELYLWGNRLSGAIPAELGNLSNLGELNLYSNRLSGAIPAELGNLSNLQELWLSQNQLTGEIPAGLGSLANLWRLYLSQNQLTGEIPEELGGLFNLQWLRLFGNQLSGEIPAELGNLVSVRELDLSDNQLSGEIPSELGNLASVRELDLSDNQLSGEIPAELGSLTTVHAVNLDNNRLTGRIPAELGRLDNLRWLRLYDNQLSGEIPAELGNLANLEELDLARNELSGEIAAELGNLANLLVLRLNDNQLTGTIPASLGSLASLRWLRLSDNQLTGCIPEGLREVAFNDLEELGLPFCDCTTGSAVADATNNPGLVSDCEALLASRDTLAGTAALNWSADTPIVEWDGVVVQGTPHRVTQLVLRSKELTGTIPEELGGLSNLRYLDLCNNGLTGEIPPELGSLARLGHLELSFNSLTGTIPTQLGSLTDLRILRVVHNGLTGEIPAELGRLSKLQELNFGGNRLNGEIPTELRSLSTLQVLEFGLNELSGEIPTWLGGLANLQVLSLRHNQLTGEIPGQLGRLTNLRELRLEVNDLSGEIPRELAGLSNLQRLDLGFNHLNGEIPPGLGRLSNLALLRLASNQLAGPITEELANLTSLETLDLTNNQLTGQIPAWLEDLYNLDALYLSRNQFTESIPAELGRLNNLRELILSRNQLTGEIPTELGNLSNLQVLMLRYNRLTGPIPTELADLPVLRILLIEGNQLTGCVPEGLREVESNDLGVLGLPFCDVLLSGLAIDPGELTPAFDAYHTDYTAVVMAPHVTVTATHDDNTTLRFLDANDVEFPDADATLEGHQVDLDHGVNIIRMRVASQDGLATRTYVMVVTRSTVPGPPAVSAVTPGGGYLTVSWTAPAETGGADITAYDLRYIDSAAADKADGSWTVVGDVWTVTSGGDLRYNITGLTGGTQYDVQVRAVNAAGTGLWSAAVTGTPETPSACVTGGAIADATNTELVSDCEALLVAGDVLAVSASLNWAADKAIAQWDGVRLGGTPQRVTRLWLPGKGLGGTVPAGLGRLSMLTDLNLRTNGLSGPIPTELGDLTNLVRLNLHSNDLSGAIPDLSDLIGLEELYLARNELTGPVPAWLNGMTEMRELWLWGNELSGTIPDLSGMTSLEKLKLAANDLEGGVPEASALPAKLRWLIIQENPLGGTIPDLSGMTSLTVLWLHTNGLAGEIPAAHLPSSVTSVNLHTNQFSGKIPDLSGLDKLQWLRLQSNQLSGMIPSTLGDMDSLTRLWLHENMLSGSIPAWFGRLTKLERLWLSDNMLSGEIPEELGELSNHSLVQWRLGGNRLTGCVPAGLAAVSDSDLGQLGLDVCETPGRTVEEEIASLAWVADGTTGDEQEGVKLLRSFAASSLHGFWGLVRKPWIRDDFTEVDSELVLHLRRAATGSAKADESILLILKMPFLESAEEADIRAMKALGVLGQRNTDLLHRALSGPLSESGITDDQTDIVPLLLMEQYDTEAADAISVLPWVEDGLVNGDQDMVIDLQLMAAESRDVFWALMRLPWIRERSETAFYVIRDFGYIATGEDRDGDSALRIANMPFLETMESIDRFVTRILSRTHLREPGSLPELLSDPRLRSGITDASAGVVLMLGLEEDSPEIAEQLWALPWIADGFTEGEAPLLERLILLAKKDIRLALVAGEYIDPTRDVSAYLLRVLLSFTWSGQGVGLGELESQTWFSDGLGDQEAALMVTLFDVARRNPELYSDLLGSRHTQYRTVSLPLAGEVNIWVIQNDTFPPGEDLLTIIEDTARIAEGFLGVAFPTTDIILLVVPNDAGIGGGHHGTHMVLTRWLGNVNNIPHETAHYYFFFNFGQVWFREGAAQFVEAYVNDRKGVEDLADRMAEVSGSRQRGCHEYENIRHYNYHLEHILRGRFFPGGCAYGLGEDFLFNVLETVGEEAMSSALRELYLSNDVEYLLSERGEPPTEEEIYRAFLKHAPPDRKEAFRDLYRRLHGGAWAFPATGFSDHHGDEATAASVAVVGEVVEGTLDYMFDFDYFRFRAEEGQRYRINVDHGSLRFNSVMLYAPDGLTPELFKWKSRWRVSSGPQMLWTAPMSGDYYFAVHNFGGKSGSYTLTITAVEDAEDDHGDTLSDATDLAAGEVVEGVVDDDFDYDYFRFQAVEGREYRVEVTRETLKSLRLRLYTSDGAAPPNRYGNQYRDDSASGGGFRWVAPSSGQFYVALDGYRDNVGTYTIAITESEPGQTSVVGN